MKHHETLLKHCETSLEHSPFDATISALDAETSALDAETSALGAVTSAHGMAISALARSFRLYRGGVSSNGGVGITPQMCNRVTSHADMDTFSKPGVVHRIMFAELSCSYFQPCIVYCWFKIPKKYKSL